MNALTRMCKGADEGIDGGSHAPSEVIYNDEYAIIREYAIGALEEIGLHAGN